MKMQEIVESASVGATSAGSIAPTNGGLGIRSRSGGSMLSGKYSTDPTPNTPREYKRNKHARRRFENSPGH